MSIPAGLRHAVWQRARVHCEYCLISEQDSLAPHEPDHIVAAQHGGLAVLENLALACYDCNHHKGPNLASLDPQTGQSVFLFNPRRQRWTEHFRLDGAVIAPLTPLGRATAALLRFNEPQRIRLRLELQKAGTYPTNSC